MRILFVCVENSCRSQMAEALTNMLSHDGVEAYSAGSEPGGVVNPRAIEVMRELGYDLSAHRSKSLEELPDLEFDYAITLGCGDECPLVKARMTIDWDIPDPRDMTLADFRAVRDLIRGKVSRLLVAPRIAAD